MLRSAIGRSTLRSTLSCSLAVKSRTPFSLFVGSTGILWRPVQRADRPLEMATEFLNAVRVRPWFFKCCRVRPSVSVFFFWVASTYVRHTDR